MFTLTPFRRRETGLTSSFTPLFTSSFLDAFFNDPIIPSFISETGQMKVDIKENDKNYVIEAELPGIKKEEIGLDLDNNVLTISVERKEEFNEENDKYIRKERRFGTMKRSFIVENINEEQISAKFENGILALELPKIKTETKKINKIDIQ